jgi:hypothetical protein
MSWGVTRSPNLCTLAAPRSVCQNLGGSLGSRKTLPTTKQKLMPTSGPWALFCLSYLSGRPKLGRG